MARAAYAETGCSNLCLAGGVALNCVGNGRILREGPFDNLWIQPAAGDAGGALGVASLIWHRHLGGSRHVNGDGRDSMKGAYLGPSFSSDEIESALDDLGAVYRKLERDELIDAASDVLASEKVLGWFNGRMEFGPRALGARSILGDPRNPEMQKNMNVKIKFRESFRPFAPTVLAEKIGDYFEIDRESPYMLLVAPVREDRRIPLSEEDQALFGIEKLNVPRSDIPAVTHVNYSARIQSVNRVDNPDYHDLIAAFEKKTGCGVVVNTSFNVRGEPIVCTPEDAYTCFMRTNMDFLAVGSFLLDKAEQPEWVEEKDWRDEIELD